MSAQPAYYFYRLRNDSFILEFCVANASDPEQYVDSRAPDGTLQRWAKHHDGDLLVFTPPDGYDGGPVGWMYNRRLQQGHAAPRAVLEREALRCRHSG
jgi:hypothetical protein